MGRRHRDTAPAWSATNAGKLRAGLANGFWGYAVANTQLHSQLKARFHEVITNPDLPPQSRTTAQQQASDLDERFDRIFDHTRDIVHAAAEAPMWWVMTSALDRASSDATPVTWQPSTQSLTPTGIILFEHPLPHQVAWRPDDEDRDRIIMANVDALFWRKTRQAGDGEQPEPVLAVQLLTRATGQRHEVADRFRASLVVPASEVIATWDAPVTYPVAESAVAQREDGPADLSVGPRAAIEVLARLQVGAADGTFTADSRSIPVAKRQFDAASNTFTVPPLTEVSLLT